MPTRPTDWTPLRATDPLPGAPTIPEGASEEYDRTLNSLNTTAAALANLASTAEMKSEAVTALRERSTELKKSLSEVVGRYAVATSVMEDYAAALRSAQHEADAALDRAQAAQRAHDLAADELTAVDRAEARLDPGTPTPPAWDTRRETAERDRARAQAVIDEAQRDLEAALLAHEIAGDDAARRLRQGTHDEVRDGWWEDWGKSAMEWTSKIGGWVAGIAGALALVLAWVPGLGPALAAVATIAGVLTLIADVALALAGSKGWGDVAIGAVGLATFGIGRAAMGAFRAGSLAVRGVSRLHVREVALVVRAPGQRIASLLPRLAVGRWSPSLTHTGATELSKAWTHAGGLRGIVVDAFHPVRAAKDVWRDLTGVATVADGNAWRSAARGVLDGSRTNPLLMFTGLGGESGAMSSLAAQVAHHHDVPVTAVASATSQALGIGQASETAASTFALYDGLMQVGNGHSAVRSITATFAGTPDAAQRLNL